MICRSKSVLFCVTIAILLVIARTTHAQEPTDAEKEKEAAEGVSLEILNLLQQLARAMAELAILLKEKGDDAEAASLLDDAASLIKPNSKDERPTNALLSFGLRLLAQLLIVKGLLQPQAASSEMSFGTLQR